MSQVRLQLSTPPVGAFLLALALLAFDARADEEGLPRSSPVGLAPRGQAEPGPLAGVARGAAHESAASHRQACRVALAEGRLAEAVAAAERATRAAPDSAAAWALLGSSLAERIHELPALQKPAVARRLREAFEEAVRLEPGHVEARLALMEFHRRAPALVGGHSDAVEVHRRALLDRAPIRGRMALARREAERGRTKEAEGLLRWLLAERPELGLPRVALAELLADSGRREEALALARSALSLHPGDADAARLVARLGDRTGSAGDGAFREATTLR